MLKCLSGYSDEVLRYYLARVREISSLGSEAALIETDKLVWEIINSESSKNDSDNEWEREDAEAELKSLKQDLTDLKNKLKRKVQVSNWQVEELRERLDELGTEWDKATAEKFANEIEKIKHEGMGIADEAAVSVHLYIINEALNQPIHNVSSVQTILRQLKEALEFLESHNQLTDELRQKIRQCKERAAWFRAKKKLADAEVAEAGGSYIKAPKLRKEATVLLAQDWAVAFPDEEPPSINILSGT